MNWKKNLNIYILIIIKIMNIFNDNFNSNNSLCLTFSGKGLNDTSNILNNYLKSGIGFQLLSNNSNYKEFVIADTSNINSNYFASLRIAIEKSQISLKSITSNNIIQPLIVNSNIYISCNIAVGVNNSLYDIEAKSNINAYDYFIKGANLSNIFTTSNVVQASIQNLSNLTNGWIKSTSTIIYTNSNVGINKSNPTYNLDVVGNINFTGDLTKNGVSFLNGQSISYGSITDAPPIIWKIYGSTNKTYYSGKVGINSTIPISDLDVVGDINFTGTLKKNNQPFTISWDYVSPKPTFSQLAYSGDWSDLKNANTGILSGLKIYYSNIINTPTLAPVATGGSYSNLSDKPIIITDYNQLANTPTIPFSLNGTNIYNSNTGNVGINNSSPNYKLDVSGDINFTGNLRYQGTAINLTNWGQPFVKQSEITDLARTADWNLILRNKPTLFDTDWSKITNIPSFLTDGSISNWNFITTNKPQYYPTSWENVSGRPNLHAVATTGNYYSLANYPTLSKVALSGNYGDLSNAPQISSFAKSGNYYDLSNLPILFSSNYYDLINRPVLFSCNYEEIRNPPYIPFTYNAQNNSINNKNTNGNVGINNPSPSHTLDVIGNINIGTGYFYKIGGVNITNTTATFSDYRIKNNIQDVNDLSCLDQFMKLKTKNFNYIDTLDFGSKNTIGFIAQEVNDIIPDAVRITEEYIPNIYKNYSLISSNSILIDDDNINKISIEDFIKLKINNQTFLTKVIDKKGNIIITEDIIDNNSNCFLYGTKVNDFHILDKTFLYTLNISATQELYKIVEEQKKEIDELKLAVAKLIR